MKSKEGDYMRNKFRYMYNSIRFKCFYYEHYLLKSASRNTLYTAVPLVCAITGLTALFSASSLPAYTTVAATLLIVAGQVFATITHLLPFSKRAQMLTYLVPDIALLLEKIDHDWSLVESNVYDEAKINDLIRQYGEEFINLECKVAAIAIPRDKKCEELAMKDTEAYFNVKYSSESDTDAPALNSNLNLESTV